MGQKLECPECRQGVVEYIKMHGMENCEFHCDECGATFKTNQMLGMLFGQDAMLRANDKDNKMLKFNEVNRDANDIFVDETIEDLNHFIQMERCSISKESKTLSTDEQLDLIVSDIFATLAS